MKIVYTFFYIAGISICLAGCYYDKEDKLYPNSAGNSNATCDTSLAKYSKDVASIINSKCAISGCHVANGQPPDLSAYSGVAINKARIKVRAIDEKTMPAAGPLNNCEMLKLQTWIDNGGQND